MSAAASESAASAPTGAQGERPRPARIAVMPAYNEAATIEAVLDDLYPRVDRLVIVDDGSIDATGEIVDRWAAGRPGVSVVHFPENRGLSAALRAGWEHVRGLLTEGAIEQDDVAFSIDADGQHEPAALDGMIDHLVVGDYDCVIGRRDLSYHTPYKVIGNAAMTWIGRISGWTRFEDIESGYRVFRVGPLLAAQEFYRGYKYSETVEVAVILARLGYRVDNTHRIHIPVARTRTRLYDAAVDAVCMPLSWYRLACWRDLPAKLRAGDALAAPAVVVSFAVVALLLMLLKPFYLGDDSAHSYAHVWYLARAIFDRGEFPLYVDQLEAGDAVMFPYGLTPWLPAAILRPALGDWAVTLAMVAGVVLLVVGMWRFRPRTRNPVLFALFLLNPLLWDSILEFQLATVWAFALFFFGTAEYDRRRNVLAALLLATAFYAHPLMAGLAAAVFAAWEAVRLRRLPLRLAATALAGAVAAIPALYWMYETPLVDDAGPGTLALGVATNLRRLSIIGLPLVLSAAAPVVLRYWRPLALAGAGATAGTLLAFPPSGLWTYSDARFGEYLAENQVDGGTTYRVMTANDREDGMVEMMRAGATLSTEFFSESIRREAFSSLAGYECLLATRGTEHVLLHASYKGAGRRGEQARLEEMVRGGFAELEYDGADGRAYLVHPPESARKPSLRDCDIG